MNNTELRKRILLIPTLVLLLTATTNTSAAEQHTGKVLPETITVKSLALNPEGIEYNEKDHTFLLSSLNAMPFIKVKADGSFQPLTSGEKFPLSTAGLHLDDQRNRLLVAGFNGTELMDNDPKTKGIAFLRVYNIQSGVLEQDINLSSLIPNASAYFANDVTVDDEGNVYISDWYARVIYKVDIDGKPSVFWRNTTGIPSGVNGLDFHPDGYLLASIISVNNKGLYTDYGLVKVPVKEPKTAKLVQLSHQGFTGFDGMVITAKGHVVGVTNDGKSPGGNTLIELSSQDGWQSARLSIPKLSKPVQQWQKQKAASIM